MIGRRRKACGGNRLWRWSLTLAVGLAAATGVAAVAQDPIPPTASRLLEEMVAAYAESRDQGYRDRGEVRIDGQGFRFETAAGPAPLFRFTWTEPDGTRTVLWRDDAGEYRWSGKTGEMEGEVPLLGALSALLSGAAFDALTVPSLLIAGAAAFEPAEGLAVDGPERCGEATCWVVTLGRLAGTVESRLWLDRESSRLQRVEIDHFPPPAPVAVESFRSLRLTLEEAGEAIAGPSFDPPNRPDEAAPALDPGAFGETIEVSLRTIALRAVDSRGEPIANLEPDDLRVTRGRLGKRQEVPVIAVDWIAAASEAGTEPTLRRSRLRGARLRDADPAEEAAVGFTDAPVGTAEEQSILFFIQPDMHAVRTKGHLRILPELRKLLAALPADDRAAVVSFDSHLKLWHDFTLDRDAVYRAIERSVRFSAMPEGRRLSEVKRDGPGLAEHFDVRAARDVARPEEALRTVAEILDRLPGEKAVIWLGWGLGRYGGGGVSMGRDYSPAVRRLASAQATVFVLDITDADFHTLEIGLQRVAADTGGTYERTHVFTGQVVQRLARTLAGYYRVTLATDEIPDNLRVTLRSKEGRILLRPGRG